MRLLRSWPAQVPPGRAHVHDSIERLVIDRYDYAAALADLDDDLLLVEWDIAFGPDDLERFTTAALKQPDRVLVAPYRLWVSTVRSAPLPTGPVWAHRYATGQHVAEGDPFCDWFGLGMAYLPRVLVAAFLDHLTDVQARNQWPEGMTDCTFSHWHHRVVGRPVPIRWDVRPVHLHHEGA